MPYKDLIKRKTYMNAYGKTWKKLNPDKVKAYNKKIYQLNKQSLRKYKDEWVKNNPDKVLDAYYKLNYNITLKDYNNIFKKQEGKCSICSKHQSEFVKRLAVDHNHITGKVRGLLCPKCNKGMGLFNEDIDLILKVIDYLKVHNE
jgi:hypothetical protein